MPAPLLALPDALCDQMRAHAQTCLPEEACGLIAGQNGSGVLCLPVTNLLHSATAYQMEPIEMLAAFNWFEAEELELLAIFHSHPAGPQAPSPTDVSMFAYPGVYTLILSPAGSGWQVRAFLIEPDIVSEVVIHPESRT